MSLSSNWSKMTLKCAMAFVKCHHFFLGAWSLKTRVRCWEYTFTNILKEFVQALITSEKKKTRHVLCRNLLSQHIHLLCKWEYFLKNIMGNVDASKISKIFNLFLFHSLALRDVHILILSNLSYWLVQHKYHASRHVEL